MRDASLPYCIADKRDLTARELELLTRLAVDTPKIARHFERLKVVARCGCGRCPTILLSDSYELAPITSKVAEVAGEWMGTLTTGSQVGVVLYASAGFPTELEAWSPAGEAVDHWPSIDSLMRFVD